MLFQLIPRKGTEADNIFAGCTLHEHFNLSPQGDGNEECCISFVRCHPFQLILARGRKPCFDVPKIGVLLFQLIPARGRKRVADIMINHKLRFQLIPARGRKHVLVSEKFIPDCTIPVRGRKLRPTIDIFEPLSTIPVRGRKLLLHQVHHGCVRTIPVRGRKRLDTLFVGVQFCTIPVRGRKLAILSLVASSRISTYPRKGTETHHSGGR